MRRPARRGRDPTGRSRNPVQSSPRAPTPLRVRDRERGTFQRQHAEHARDDGPGSRSQPGVGECRRREDRERGHRPGQVIADPGARLGRDDTSRPRRGGRRTRSRTGRAAPRDVARRSRAGASDRRALWRSRPWSACTLFTRRARAIGATAEPGVADYAEPRSAPSRPAHGGYWRRGASCDRVTPTVVRKP